MALRSRCSHRGVPAHLDKPISCPIEFVAIGVSRTVAEPSQHVETIK
jgi:hypothetical protein